MIEDDMNEILERMKGSDAFIFGTPNHMRTVTAPMLNFLTRMLPLLVFKLKFDKDGNAIGADMSSKIKGKKAVIVISQGEPFFCSSLVYDVLQNNLIDFGLEGAGNIISMGNFKKGDVAGNENDLEKAFKLGLRLAAYVEMA